MLLYLFVCCCVDGIWWVDELSRRKKSILMVVVEFTDRRKLSLQEKSLTGGSLFPLGKKPLPLLGLGCYGRNWVLKGLCCEL